MGDKNKSEKESTFFDCPECGDKGRIVGAVKDEEVAKGKFDSKLPCGSKQVMIPVFDPRKPTLICPVVLIVYDVCATCGFEAPREVHYTTGQPRAMMAAPPGQRPGQGQGPNRGGSPFPTM